MRRANSLCWVALASCVGLSGCGSDGGSSSTESGGSSGATGASATGGTATGGVGGGATPTGGTGNTPMGAGGSGPAPTSGGSGPTPTSGGSGPAPSSGGSGAVVNAGGSGGSSPPLGGGAGIAAGGNAGEGGAEPSGGASAGGTEEASGGQAGSTEAGAGGSEGGAGNATAGAGGADAGAGGSTPEVESVCPYEGGVTPSGQNWVGGELIEFNDNGGWCWYQDERAIVDKEAGKLIIASIASGGSRNAHVEVTHWDLASGTSERHHLGTMSYTDDHDVAALIKRREGGYAAMWAGHNDDCNSYYSVFDGQSWSSSGRFGWPECPTPSGKRITYANLWYLGDTLHSFVRSIDTSPHYLFSQDGGNSWTLGGRLTSTPQVGYVAGYYKYWGNNEDRIDFFGTEAHPRDNDNSLYHGYIQGGKIYDSDGNPVDQDSTDRQAKDIPLYTHVFDTGTTINGVRLEHMWNADLVRYDDGTIAAIGTGRVSGTGSDDPDKRLLYFRYDGSNWNTTYLAKAGTKLYSSEQDYTGLGALDPDDPHVIYISTPYDPRTDEGSFNGKKEIWKGITCDDGATFDWEPVTSNSQMDNLRPIVPKWDAQHTAVLWLRGQYQSAQEFSFKVVGLIEER